MRSAPAHQLIGVLLDEAGSAQTPYQRAEATLVATDRISLDRTFAKLFKTLRHIS
jgi:hypothetical protein